MRARNVYTISLLFLTSTSLQGQRAGGGVTQPAAAPQSQTTSPLLQNLRWRNIGPANFGGRVSDIEVVESNPAIIYVGAASGGVWKSVNAGTTWETQLTDKPTANIGDIAVFQRNPDIVWVGTGEACVRNSIGWGDGIYKSTDGGRTFTNMGLKDSHHIDKIITHPTNPDIVWVAAQGHLWGYNDERGLYKTTDGGRSWRKITRGLPNDNRTGAAEIEIDPRNPNVLYVAMWERIRHPHKFLSGGPNGGLFKSTDGGESFTKLTNGLPSGEMGKIGLSIYRKNPRIIVAIVEAAPSRPGGATGADTARVGSGIYRSEDAGASWRRVNTYNSRPFYFSHIYVDPNDSSRVYVLAADARVSSDGGRTFSGTLDGLDVDFHAMWINPANSNHFYIGNDKGAAMTFNRGEHFIHFDNMDLGQFYAVTVDNRDPYWVYGGLQDNGNWGGPSNSRDFNGILTDHWFKFHSGDGFHTTVDPNDWRTVYTEAQNGSIRRYDAMFRQVGRTISPNANNILNYSEVFPARAGGAGGAAGAGGGGGRGGRGGGGPSFRYNWNAPLYLSPHDSKTLLFGGQYLFRSTDRGETWRVISPDLTTNTPEFINTPDNGGLTGEGSGAENHSTLITISESPVTPGVIWAGTDDGNVQVTRDDGRTWTNVRSNIPAAARNNAAAPSAGVPAGTWVSRVEASHFESGTAYVSFDGHRSDDMRPHVWKTTDYGRTWTNISSNLPRGEPVYVVKEDLKNPNLLFAGTEFSAFASVDGGASWQKMMTGMPTVPVHDLVIHPRESDLIAATHGRSIWILDDISPLQQLTPQILASDAHLFIQKTATIWHGVSRGATRGHKVFQGRNPLTIAHRPPANSPSDLQNSATISFYLRNAPAGPVRLEISNIARTLRFAQDIPAVQGINRYFWNMSLSAVDPAATAPAAAAAPPDTAGRGGRGAAGAAAAAGAAGGRGGAGGAGGRAGAGGGGGGGRGGGRGGGGSAAAPGVYLVQLTVGGRTLMGSLTIRDDPALPR